MGQYETFAALGFGQALAEVIQEEGGTKLTDEYRIRAAERLNLTASALSAVFSECERRLRAGQQNEWTV